jgi:hypothetical protein
MFSSSAFRVLHLSAHELQVVSPPHYLLVLVFALPAILGLWLIWRGFVIKSLLAIALGLVWCGGWGFGSWACSRSSSVLLDSAANTVTVDSPHILFGRDHFAVPLDQVRNAQIATSHASERIVLVLKSGRYMDFTGYSDQAGQEEAVQAINDFLGVRGG